MAAPARVRMNRTAILPVLLLLVCVVPLASAAVWTPVLLLVPAVAGVWVLRRGVDVDADALTVHSLLGRRRVAWDDLAGIRIGRRGRLWLVTTGGDEVHLPVLRARDLPGLSELSGGRFRVPAPPRAVAG